MDVWPSQVVSHLGTSKWVIYNRMVYQHIANRTPKMNELFILAIRSDPSFGSRKASTRWFATRDLGLAILPFWTGLLTPSKTIHKAGSPVYKNTHLGCGTWIFRRIEPPKWFNGETMLGSVVYQHKSVPETELDPPPAAPPAIDRLQVGAGGRRDRTAVLGQSGRASVF